MLFWKNNPDNDSIVLNGRILEYNGKDNDDSRDDYDSSDSDGSSVDSEDDNDSTDSDGSSDDTEGEDHVNSMIHTNHPIPLYLNQYYFELTIVNVGKDESIEIGLTQMIRNDFDDTYSVPKWDAMSIAYHLSGRIVRSDTWSNHGMRGVTYEAYTTGDVIGCLTSRIWINNVSFWKIQFIKNGSIVNDPIYFEDGYYCPIITMNSVGAKLAANLGQTEFSFQNQGNIASLNCYDIKPN